MIKALPLLVMATASQADPAWDTFVARCLEPYENHALAITSGLPEQSRDGYIAVFGPTEDGARMVLDAAPAFGERACSVETAEVSTSAFDAWRRVAETDGLYVPFDGGWASNEWIEPQLRIEATFEPGRALFTVIETELES